ncbi:DNA-3-methyladenine glycosylase I [Paucibacter sp. O1-1]|uniref:DNA-3-methyladenine glycosylase I n=1 Tax=Paucibacter sp. M5-1 TaxID=3015998 RepID=UPI0010F58DB2|nr:DNA-3-methyladenine glycosylase I [Paucibacter sp. M5-1]MCU7374020.1 DNA-3-methyladenine glycosylase I [Paucibacter sp. O1-1]MCZ7880328.1 DNA-3-methyladenine glycosylase I [Paucibacter sp. M5-1]MDA3829022.1 DNA-3-methyladenine glycosylase I [Paucibacter sp. O1-1]
MNPQLHIPADGRPRCRWCAAAADWPPYLHYHDTEWGFPVADDRRLFEKLCLEGFQSGLSWRTILAKREAFRAAFAGFDVERVAAFDAADVERLLQDAGIVRHRGKIEAVINNAQRLIELVAEQGSLAAYIWRFEPEGGHENLTESPASKALSKDLKKRGWKFVGPTTMHAFMQSMGLINDHAPQCVTHAEVAAARRRFKPPR